MHTMNIRALKRLNCPVLPPNILRRKALLATLSDAMMPSSGYKLILVCAPAGYGKTTLLADFIQHAALPCCWYFLDYTDTDKDTFLSLLTTSICEQFPQCKARCDQLLARLDADVFDAIDGPVMYIMTLVDTLIAIIEEEISTRFAIAICNYHEMKNTVFIKIFMNHFLSHLPAQCVVLLESRAVPELELAPFLAHREIFGLGSSGLRFSPQEIYQLAQLQGNITLTMTEARELAETFDGWITGILLSTRLGDLQFLHTASATSFPTWEAPAMRMSRQNLFAYVLNEIFSRDPEGYTFIKELSILQVMEPDLCNKLLGISDALDRLTYLERQGLFVIRTDEGSQSIFLCHPALRELFGEALHKQNPARFQALQRRAAELFAATHDYAQAIYHAYQAEEYHFVVEMIMNACTVNSSGDFSESLTHWIDKLPDEMMRTYPRLLVIRAKAHLSFGKYADALPLLGQALKHIDDNRDALLMSEDEILFLRAEISLARSKTLWLEGKYEQAQELCRDVLDVLSPDEVTLRTDAHLRLGMCARQLGNFTTSITEFQQALQLERRHAEGTRTARLYRQLANVYHMVGNHTLSDYYRTRAAQCWEQLHDDAGKVNNLIAMGVVHQRKGEFIEAEQVLEKALVLANTLHFLQGQAYALVSLGDLYQDQKKYDQALKAADDGLVLVRKLKDHSLITYTLCLLVMTYLLMDDLSTAQLFFSEIDQLIVPNETMSYERALRDLTCGTILLYQQQYREALTYLTRVEILLRSHNLKRELLQTLIRLAACYIAIQDMYHAIKCMQEVLMIIKQYEYEILARIEIQRILHLAHAIQSRPEMSFFRSYMFPEVAMREPEIPADQESSSHSLTENEVVGMAMETPKLRIFAFGEPTIFLQTTPITHWRVVNAMELCFFLLDREYPCHKEQIFTALWPDKDEIPDQALRTTIYYLRKALGEGTVISKKGFYSLNLSAVYGKSIWYDVELFSEQYEAANTAFTQKDTHGAYTLFNSVVELYRGDYLQPFYHNWCIPRRTQLQQMYMKARHQLASIAWQSERFDECVAHWQAILTLDNCQEDAHYGLMRCYLRQGKRGLALRQYQHCMQVLREELAVTPGPTIQALYNRLVGNM